jgi:hypothetical protein
MSVRPDSERADGVAPLIVGVDGSERSRDALALAVQLAEPGQGILLAHVHPYALRSPSRCCAARRQRPWQTWPRPSG